jgi:hypothetical protein
MKQILLLLSPLLLFAQPTEVMKKLMKEGLEDVKRDYKYNNENAKLEKLYLDDITVTYEFSIDYDKYSAQNNMIKSIKSKEDMKRLNSMIFAVALRKEVRDSFCSDPQIRGFLKEGFEYQINYKWIDSEQYFVRKNLSEKECKERYDKGGKYVK